MDPKPRRLCAACQWRACRAEAVQNCQFGTGLARGKETADPVRSGRRRAASAAAVRVRGRDRPMGPQRPERRSSSCSQRQAAGWQADSWRAMTWRLWTTAARRRSDRFLRVPRLRALRPASARRGRARARPGCVRGVVHAQWGFAGAGAVRPVRPRWDGYSRCAPAGWMCSAAAAHRPRWCTGGSARSCRFEGDGHPRPAGQLSGSEIEGEVGLAVVPGGVAHPPRLAVDDQIIAALADQDRGQAGRPVRSSGKVNPAAA
jgi:hypothetical protein